MQSLQELQKWLASQPASEKDKGLQNVLVLFEGNATTTKAAAMKLAKEQNKELYVIQLSKLVSKYIGETEKNLSAVFNKAETTNGILFFDEADALFGKRTTVKDSHDRYANQEVSYLLQQIEKFCGLIIMAVTERKNIDEAFTRRLQFIISFQKTDVKENKL